MLQFFLVFANTVGVMAICTMLFGQLQRRLRLSMVRRACTGLAMGAGGVVVMLQPSLLEAGFQADARGAFVGMAGAFGGAIAAAIAVVMTVMARAAIGGDGAVLGMAVIFATAAAAWIWRRRFGHCRKRTWAAWLLICLACVSPTMVALWHVAGVTPQLLLGPVIAFTVLIFGKMLETEQRRGQRERDLARAASTDMLTNLPNRRALEERAQELEGAGAEDVLFLLLDVDHFKRINDEHGHDTGDAVLRAIGATIRRTLRDGDFAARVGGEEFAILVRTGDRDNGRIIAERFRAALQLPYGPPDKGRRTQVSIGAYFFDGRPFNYVEGYRRADAALYRAKAEGRDRVTFGAAGARPGSDGFGSAVPRFV